MEPLDFLFLRTEIIRIELHGKGSFWRERFPLIQLQNACLLITISWDAGYALQFLHYDWVRFLVSSSQNGFTPQFQNFLLMNIVLNLGIQRLDFTVMLRAIAHISFAWHLSCGPQQFHSPSIVLLLDTKLTLKILRLCFTCMYGVRIQLSRLQQLIQLSVFTFFPYTLDIGYDKWVTTLNNQFLVSKLVLFLLILLHIRVTKLIL